MKNMPVYKGRDEIEEIYKWELGDIYDSLEAFEKDRTSLLEQLPEQRALIRLATQDIAHLSVASQATFGRVYQDEFIGRLEALLAQGIEKGELRAVDVRLLTRTLLGMVYPFLLPAVHDSGGAGQIVDLLLMVFFDGMAEPPGHLPG